MDELKAQAGRPPQRGARLTRRWVSWGLLGGGALLLLLVGIAWRATSAAWFLLFPLLLLGALIAGAMATLWALRHF